MTQTGAVNDVLAVRVETVPLAVEPVLVVTDEEIPIAHPEEAAGHALTILEAGVDRVQQFPLPILFAEDVFMGPGVPVGDRLPPGGLGDEFRQFCVSSRMLQDCRRVGHYLAGSL